MKRCLILFTLLLIPFVSWAQFATRADSSYYSRATRIYQNGEKLANDEVNKILLSRIGNGETMYSQYLKAQKTYKRGFINLGAGLALAGVFGWLQVKAFEKGGCVSPGGFPFIIGGLAWSGYGVYQTISATNTVRDLTNDINSAILPSGVTPQVSQDGLGVRFNF